ncbi:MAG: hypothetical protein CL676_10615 [Bdellovibrionaceae bacterium]|nr:hypothetical protein [Pseudobdellovibrionaceae bacterium]
MFQRVVTYKIALKLFLGVLAFACGKQTLAQTPNKTLSPEAVFTRCHLQLTGMAPDDKTNPQYLAVKNGTKDPSQACIEIFNLAKLDGKGELKLQNNLLARRVLSRIHNIHTNFLTQKVPYPNDVSSYTAMANDIDEPALYFTRAALVQGAKYSEVLTHNSGLAGRRRVLNGTPLRTLSTQRLFTPLGSTSTDFNFPRDSFTMAFYAWNSTNFGAHVEHMEIPDSDLTEFGALVGVKDRKEITIPNGFISGISSSLGGANREVLKSQYNNPILNEHFGGGILGSQSYIIANINLPNTVRPDGLNQINRRLGARIYEDMLCHQLPTLRPSDVEAFVAPRSSFPFQQQNACMQCHQSFDPLAYGYRNLVLSRSAFGAVRDQGGYLVSGMFKVPNLNDSNFFSTTAPNGKIAFRSLLDHKLVSQSFSNLNQLGSALAQTDDFYLCAAKKYYKTFTGVNVQLTDREPAGTVQAAHQNEVIKLGKFLKTTQSLEKMLKMLFQSKIYQSTDFSATEVSE